MADRVSLFPFASRSSQHLRCGQRNPIPPLDLVTDYQEDTTQMAVAPSTSQAECRQRETAADVEFESGSPRWHLLDLICTRRL